MLIKTPCMRCKAFKLRLKRLQSSAPWLSFGIFGDYFLFQDLTVLVFWEITPDNIVCDFSALPVKRCFLIHIPTTADIAIDRLELFVVGKSLFFRALERLHRMRPGQSEGCIVICSAGHIYALRCKTPDKRLKAGRNGLQDLLVRQDSIALQIPFCKVTPLVFQIGELIPAIG